MTVIEWGPGTEPRQIPSWIEDMDFCHIVSDDGHAYCGDARHGGPATCIPYCGEAICPSCGLPTCPRCAQLSEIEDALE